MPSRIRFTYKSYSRLYKKMYLCFPAVRRPSKGEVLCRRGVGWDCLCQFRLQPTYAPVATLLASRAAPPDQPPLPETEQAARSAGQTRYKACRSDAGSLSWQGHTLPSGHGRRAGTPASRPDSLHSPAVRVPYRTWAKLSLVRRLPSARAG